MKNLKRYACGLFVIIFALVLAFGSGCGEFLSILVAVDGAVNTTMGGKAAPTIKDAADSLESYWG